MDIFISSVSRDLKLERQAVLKQILTLGDKPIGMEHFGASPAPPLDECLSQLEDADLMVLILGPSYGSVHPGTGISYTENEYRHARKLGIPVLVFVADHLRDKIGLSNDAPISSQYVRFVESIKETYDPFPSPDALAAAVSAGISNYKRRHGELGRRLSPFTTWGEYFSWLLDPHRYLNHSWALVGRQGVLGRINDFTASDAKVAVLYGAGGLGKSRILLEFGRALDEQKTGWKLRFLRETVSLSNDFARGLPADPCILVIDDAHRQTRELEVILPLLHVKEYADRTKLILSARPSGKQMLGSILNRNLESAELADLGQLEPLDHLDVRNLASQALGSSAAVHLNRLVSASSQSPLVTVVGGRLVRDKQLDPALFSTDEDFRKAVLDRLTVELTSGLPAPAQPWKDLLVVISALGPIRAADPRGRQLVSQFLKIEPWDLVERLGTLEQNGLLHRRGGLVQVTPDVLGDHLLHLACVSSNDEDTGLATPLFEHFANLYASNLLRNLAELQWRIDQTKGRPQIVADIWSAIKEELRSADYLGRITILEAITDAAAYQAAEAIELVKLAMTLD